MRHSDEVAGTPGVEVTVITVTYHADIATLERQILALGRHLPCLLIDNGSDNLPMLEAFAQRHANISLHALGKNTGIAYAQNFGIRKAQQQAKLPSFILFLDQDSVPGSKMVDRLLEKFRHIDQRDPRVGAVGPCLLDARNGNSTGFHVMNGLCWKTIMPPPGEDVVRVATLNSSGTLVSMQVLEHVGGPDNSLFIDHVDTEWSFRVSARGHTLYGTTAATLIHTMGENVVKYWLLGWRTMPYRVPLRHYYLVRNSVLLQRMPHVTPGWKFWNIIKLLFTLGYFGLFGEDRKRQRRSIGKGLWDGIAGHSGKAPDGLQSQ